MITMDRERRPTTAWKWASTECKELLGMYLGLSGGQQVAHSHKQSIGHLYREKRKHNAPHPILEMSVNGASKIFCFASLVIYVALDHNHP